MKFNHKSLLLLIFFKTIFTWNMYAQSNQKGLKLEIPPNPELEQKNLGYNDSWALIIGIDNYKIYPDLMTAVFGAKKFAAKLKAQFGFRADHVFELYNKDATKNEIERYLKDILYKKIGPNDRLIVYFSGHGDVEGKGPNRIGYICPQDADKSNKLYTCISMTSLTDINKRIKAKHILYLFDSCFSGMAFNRGTLPEIPTSEEEYYEKLITTSCRQAITAGTANELVNDLGPDGKTSPFTFYLLQGLDELSKSSDFGIITASALGSYIEKKVINNPKYNQHPWYDRFEYSDRGDFLLWKNKEPKTLKNYRLTTVDGRNASMHNIIKFNGNKEYFLLVFWASWCAPCHREIKYLYNSDLPENLMVITINLDDPDDNLRRTLAENYINGFPTFVNLFPFDRKQFNKIKQDITTEKKSFELPVTILVDANKKIYINLSTGFPRANDKNGYKNFKRKFIEIAR